MTIVKAKAKAKAKGIRAKKVNLKVLKNSILKLKLFVC